MSAKPSCDEFDPDNLRVEQALAQIHQNITPVSDTLELPLMQAHNHVLAQDIRSPLNVPAYTNSAMDGYALRAADLPAGGNVTLDLIGTAFAGNPFYGQVRAGQCVRIMTGAKLPEGTDTVIMQEQAGADGERITFGAGHTPGQNVRHPGEDIAVDEVVLRQGQRLRAAEIGLLASLGVPQVRVRRKLKVAFFSTGDELRPVGETLEEGQIYDSNRYTLYGMLKELDVEILDLGVIRDEPGAVEAAFEQAADQADAVITSGGVSVGEADYVKQTLDKLGAVSFWKIAMKPGKPLAFGRVKDAWFFGLPGNPVSVMATFYQFALPALRQLMGETAAPPLTFRVPCSETLKKRAGRTDFQRGILHRDEQGNLTVSAAGMQASHILSGMSRANCFIILPLEAGNIDAGTLVEVQPFRGLM
ncbi:MAG: molybdopterin molybdotransferase MoeA [Thiohalophilus sp.]